MSTTILTYRKAEYLWVSLAILIVCVLIYLSQAATDPPSGSTLQGYLLGGAGAGLIVWLSLLGIRKRRYGGVGSVQAWASAHVYLGVTLLGVVLLHSAAQVGWNVHTLAFVLMLVVIVSGIVGAGLYLVVPERHSRLRQGRSRADLFREMTELDDKCLELSRSCATATELSVRSSIERTVVGGGVFDQLFGRDRSTFMNGDNVEIQRNQDQADVLRYVAQLAPGVRTQAESAALQGLVTLMARRQGLLRRIRQDIQLQGFLELWLYVHVPVSLALIAAVLIHVFVVFWYW